MSIMASGDAHPKTYDPLLPTQSVSHNRRQYRPKAPISVITLILLILGLQFIVLPRYVYQISPSEIKLSRFHLDRLEVGLQKCAEINTPPVRYPVTNAGSRTNPRWNAFTGQNETVVLKNVKLFDGETILNKKVDIVFKKGIIESVDTAGKSISVDEHAKVFDLEGKFVTPGLVDLHSHHLAFAWPLLSATDDTNEVNSEMGPVTPQVRIIDSIKAYDMATTIIASGGVTTSLILPGSANIMGGEAVLVKNALRSGENSEEVVEEILLEHGIPVSQRRRFMKMACGENPRRVYKHTRMGNAWYFRKHMERAKELLEKQDAWCLQAEVLRENGNAAAISDFMESTLKDESATDYLEYDSSIGILRGKVGVNIHCYETEDFWDMIHHSKEFGFRIQAFHHALEAWKVPEMIKDSGDNITVATFAEFGLYKKEAYEANLWAGKILAEHGVPVAYKSDHVETETNAKYLLYQAATAHSFHLSEDLALQSVTSVPARSLEIDHRVGYARAGYDADLVVWDSHPLSIGATALNVFIDGKDILDAKKTEESLANVVSESGQNSKTPSMRPIIAANVKEEVCKAAEKNGAKITITGIQRSYLDHVQVASSGNLTMVVDHGKIICFDSDPQCVSASAESTTISLKDGHVLPGLTAVSVSLGLQEISGDSRTGDGEVKKASFDPNDTVYAKYGIHLDGRAFARARIGGVTRAVTAPLYSGFVDGVSTGIKTTGKNTILDGGIFQDDVALHFAVGQGAKGDVLSTISSEISKLRQILTENAGKDNIYGKAADGAFPLVVHVQNEYDITQLIKIKQDFPVINLIILGGAGAPLVANELAAAKIPVILTANRDAQDTWEKRNSLPGPPLSKSPAAILAEAGVLFGLAIPGEGDPHLHNLPLEASWAAKYAGLSSKDAINLVSRNIEQILGLDVKEETRDFVVFEGDPLQFGASVVLAFDGQQGDVSLCWPESN
ncbi:carbohydrate esterase family 9 protein-like protein [Hyaloscypha variabilis]